MTLDEALVRALQGEDHEDAELKLAAVALAGEVTRLRQQAAAAETLHLADVQKAGPARCPDCGTMATNEAIQDHRRWAARPTRRTPGPQTCAGCLCIGNWECGKKEPLAAPAHNCELDINDDDESGRCYCCRLAGVGDTNEPESRNDD